MRKEIGKAYRKFCPRQLQVHIDCMRASPYWERQDVIFIHTPKCAGISISTRIYGKPLGHIRAKDIKRIRPGQFYRLYKFSFVRDPSDRYLSAFAFVKDNFELLKGGPGLPSSREDLKDPVSFYDNWLSKKKYDEINYVFKPQFEFLCDGDEVLVDYLARYEDFPSEINYLKGKVPQLSSVPKMNSSSRSTTQGTIMEIRKRVQDFYEKDFVLLGYE